MPVSTRRQKTSRTFTPGVLEKEALGRDDDSDDVAPKGVLLQWQNFEEDDDDDGERKSRRRVGRPRERRGGGGGGGGGGRRRVENREEDVKIEGQKNESANVERRDATQTTTTHGWMMPPQKRTFLRLKMEKGLGEGRTRRRRAISSSRRHHRRRRRHRRRPGVPRAVEVRAGRETTERNISGSSRGKKLCGTWLLFAC